jgi:hypothetical protein
MVAPSVAKMATINPARSRPTVRSSRIKGMEMIALPICAEATTPLPMSSITRQASSPTLVVMAHTRLVCRSASVAARWK